MMGFREVMLDSEHALWLGQLPAAFMPDAEFFEQVWQLHPDHFHKVRLFDREVATPRWQQAYNRTYRYTGSANDALPLPALLNDFADWARSVDPRLNGFLLNWYDGEQGHYIGAHRDSIDGLVYGAPIVTVSLGESRPLRFRPWQGRGFKDFPQINGSVLIIPFATNLAWTHEIPKSKKARGRRISLTARAFKD